MSICRVAGAMGGNTTISAGWSRHWLGVPGAGPLPPAQSLKLLTFKVSHQLQTKELRKITTTNKQPQHIILP